MPYLPLSQSLSGRIQTLGLKDKEKGRIHKKKVKKE